MGLFFNNKKNVKGKAETSNPYLEDQQALFETKGDTPPKVVDNSFTSYVLKKEPINVPKYKASDSKGISVVIDKEALGYQNLRSHVETVDVPKIADAEQVLEFIPKDNAGNRLNSNKDTVEIIDIDDKEENTVKQNNNKFTKLSIFGGNRKPTNVKVHEASEIKGQENVEIIDVDLSPQTTDNNIKINEDGKKICPQCGAPSEIDAVNCFLCGRKF